MNDKRSSRAPSIGVAHFSAIHLAPNEFVRQAAAAGFSSVGLRLHPAFPGAPFYELLEGSDAACTLQSTLRSEGMRVFDIEFFIIDANFDAHAIESIVAAAANLGASRLTACGDDAEGGRLAENLASFCRLAQRYGLAVDVENMGWRAVRTFADSVALVEACAAENAGVLIDALHFFRNGAKASDIERSIERVKHIQLCDVAGAVPSLPGEMIAEARGGRLAPGDGELPLMELLKWTGRAANVSVEVPMVGNQPTQQHLNDLFQKTARVLTASF
uniref:sugar phosphate isomerase/epimerase family protein n=1 Tax=Neorhizobium sp. EC2-8 TaxID=3129230 RepID=UPI0031015A89